MTNAKLLARLALATMAVVGVSVVFFGLFATSARGRTPDPGARSTSDGNISSSGSWDKATRVKQLSPLEYQVTQ